MPSFVCDHCQETLKKAKLDQHAQRCRQHSFSCIDCYKSFKGVEYRSHFTCITEVQKYETIKAAPALAPAPVSTPVKMTSTKKDIHLKDNILLSYIKKECGSMGGGKISLKKIKKNKKVYSFLKKKSIFVLSNEGKLSVEFV